MTRALRAHMRAGARAFAGYFHTAGTLSGIHTLKGKRRKRNAFKQHDPSGRAAQHSGQHC